MSDGKSDEEDRARAMAAAKRKLAWAIKSQDSRRLSAMISMARSEPGIPVLPAELDRDPWLLNCPNGTVELRSGRLREHRREDLITKVTATPFDPEAVAPTWERFLDQVFGGDGELIGFVQRLLGYCLTGDVREQQVPLFVGGGSNGKSTLLGSILATVGNDYALQAPPNLLIASHGERHPTELANLFGKRLVVISETGEGKALNEERLKLLSGGDEISCRRMREDFWTFRPTHKCILQSNHRPVVRGTDHAIWRRLLLVPFNTKFWDAGKPEEAALGLPDELRKDPSMPQRLEAERPGILAWLVAGCLDWQCSGLRPPAVVTDATANYRSDEDVLGRWIEERCLVSAQLANHMTASTAYTAFRSWMEQNGEVPWNGTVFGTRMGARFEKRKVGGVIRYEGVSLRAERPEHE